MDALSGCPNETRPNVRDRVDPVVSPGPEPDVPGADELVALRHALPSVHRLERAEIQGQALGGGRHVVHLRADGADGAQAATAASHSTAAAATDGRTGGRGVDEPRTDLNLRRALAVSRPRAHGRERGPRRPHDDGFTRLTRETARAPSGSQAIARNSAREDRSASPERAQKRQRHVCYAYA